MNELKFQRRWEQVECVVEAVGLVFSRERDTAFFERRRELVVVMYGGQVVGEVGFGISIVGTGKGVEYILLYCRDI